MTFPFTVFDIIDEKLMPLLLVSVKSVLLFCILSVNRNLLIRSFSTKSNLLIFYLLQR